MHNLFTPNRTKANRETNYNHSICICQRSPSERVTGRWEKDFDKKEKKDREKEKENRREDKEQVKRCINKTEDAQSPHG